MNAIDFTLRDDNPMSGDFLRASTCFGARVLTCYLVFRRPTQKEESKTVQEPSIRFFNRASATCGTATSIASVQRRARWSLLSSFFGKSFLSRWMRLRWLRIETLPGNFDLASGPELI